MGCKGNLTSVSDRNGKNAKYTYLSDGQRYTKITSGKTTAYLYNDGIPLLETTGNEAINYYYDSNGTILGIDTRKEQVQKSIISLRRMLLVMSLQHTGIAIWY